MTISIIAAVAKKNVIGFKNELPWKLPNDLRRFKNLTTNEIVIMGRKTYESIGKPLPNRINIVLTQNEYYAPKGCIVSSSLEDALNYCKTFIPDKDIFIIGGTSVYEKALPLADKMFLTYIDKEVEGDTYFPVIDLNTWELKDQEDFTDPFYYSFNFYKKR